LKKVVDFEAFMQETGLEPDEIPELYQTFLEEIIEEQRKMIQQYQENDFTSLKKTVHNIKGVLGSYRAPLAFEKASGLNERIRDDDFINIGGDVKSLNDEIEKVKFLVKNNFF
jgi:HPt (histidine-containing phosphotransfer) domain-containing protein